MEGMKEGRVDGEVDIPRGNSAKVSVGATIEVIHGDNVVAGRQQMGDGGGGSQTRGKCKS